MDQVSAERTRRSSLRHLSSGFFATPPLRSKSTKRKRKVKAPRDVYSVRDILEEKVEHGKLHYLIDWADNSETGESYTPTWEPRQNVGWQAISDWEQKKSEIQNGGAFNRREQSSTSDSDTESIHRAKRQRISGPVRRKPLQTNTENSTGGRPAPPDKGLEIKDSYEEEQKLSSGPENLYVLVPKVNDDFDRNAYTIIPTISTDPSQATNPSQDSVYISSSPEFQNPTPIRKPFLWDEPAPVIPDSQELPGSSSYLQSEQATPYSQDTHYKSPYLSGASIDREPENSQQSSHKRRRTPLPSTPTDVSSGQRNIESPVLSQSARERNSRPSQLSVAFLTQTSESHGDSWQPAQVRSPPPQSSTELSTQPASTSEHTFVSETQAPTSQLPSNVIESIESAEDAVRYSSSPLPPRPTPPSYPTMADQPPSSSMSVAEMLRQARASAAAHTIARQAEARAASTTPSTQPPPVINQELPLRSSSELQPPASPSPRNSSEEGSTSKALQILPLGIEEYIVPLPLNAITRDIYDGELTNFRRLQKASKNYEQDESLVNEVDSLIDRLKLLCDHQDLISSDYSTQGMDPYEVQAAWAENISTKCVFLASFLTFLRPFNIHVTIIARPGRMCDILEAILRKERCIYNRSRGPDPVHNTAQIGPMTVTLLSSDFNRHGVEVGHTSVVIAFDSTFELEQYPSRLRENWLQPRGQAPVVRLTVVRSIEHFELCFDKRMDRVDRRAALLNCVMQARHEVGVLPAGFFGPPAAAAEVVRFASALRTERSWPLQPMPELDDLEFELDTAEEAQPSVVEPSQAQHSESMPESYSMSPAQLLQPTSKRSLSADDDDESSKRLRLTPVIPDEPPQTLNPSRISSLLNPMDVDPAPKLKEPDTEQVNLTSSLAKKVKDLEVELQHREATTAELRSQNQRLENNLKDLEKTIRDIVPRYQEALNDRARFEHEMKESTARAIGTRQRLDQRIAEVNRLQEAKAYSDSELAASRALLASSAIPEVAELHKMKAEVASSKAANERLDKRIASMNNELEYMRTNYQQASSAAGEAVRELSDVKAELATAQRKASENAVRIHEYHASSEIKQHLARITELETEKAELEWELEKKSEELKAMLNGRRATRGTSVPRSPRMGTMSPSSRPMARVLSVGSRGNSPAPGEGQPYRGTFTGEALFGTPASTRFGNHLM